MKFQLPQLQENLYINFGGIRNFRFWHECIAFNASVKFDEFFLTEREKQKSYPCADCKKKFWITIMPNMHFKITQKHLFLVTLSK